MLLDARSVTYTAPELGGTSGVHLLGAAEEVSASHDAVAKKAVLAKGGIDIGRRRWRSGEAEIGITLDQRDRAGQRRADGRAAAGSASALWTVYAAAIPASSTRSGRRARLRRRADLAGDGGALDGRRVRAAEIDTRQDQRASSQPLGPAAAGAASSALIGSPNTIALRVFAAELVELDRVGIGLGAFRHHLHAEVVRERDDRAQDHRARALAVGAHERLVDLDGVEREALQIGERGMAGAEIVERQAGAELADARAASARRARDSPSPAIRSVRA